MSWPVWRYKIQTFRIAMDLMFLVALVRCRQTHTHVPRLRYRSFSTRSTHGAPLNIKPPPTAALTAFLPVVVEVTLAIANVSANIRQYQDQQRRQAT